MAPRSLATAGRRRSRDLERRGHVHHRREDVVRRLRAVDVVVRVHRLLRAHRRRRTSSIARLAMTSLAFMFDCVPLPVCQTTSGKCASSLPLDDLVGGAHDEVGLGRRRACRESWLVSAAAFLTMPKARMTGRPKRCPPILKFWRERCVWAPQYLSAGTSTWPMLSDSMRTLAHGRASLSGVPGGRAMLASGGPCAVPPPRALVAARRCRCRRLGRVRRVAVPAARCRP